MAALATVVAIGLVSFLMFFFASQLEEEHGILKFLTIMFALALLIVMPAVVTNNEECSYLLTNESSYYVYGDNYSSYHWDYTSPSPSVNDISLFHDYTTYYYEEYCVTDESNTTNTFFKLVMWFYRLFITYIILFLGYNALMALKDSYKERGRK